MYAHPSSFTDVTDDALPLTGGTTCRWSAVPVPPLPPQRLGHGAAAAFPLPSLAAKSPTGHWALPHHAAAPQTARGLIAPVLDEWRLLGDPAEDVLLVVSELVTNAVRHARPPIFLAIRRTEAGNIRVEITDGGQPGELRHVETPDDPDEHGRGLIIVDYLSATHGRQIAEHGTTWWAEFTQDRTAH
ncbi:ATP-binding protein [Streptomyces sp. MBT62]|uniref:ATP-binding protein n=1 Tax=Streptomyces sp. MBT62 TaxID=2800410 RepID=UPI00190A9705|nr:ATP-binding protein [Streptomyces sp. MBT62]MBK3563829.1 ATP-binding protein [Streptomyces sp. MBT62]